jgi:hypothetical protein
VNEKEVHPITEHPFQLDQVFIVLVVQQQLVILQDTIETSIKQEILLLQDLEILDEIIHLDVTILVQDRIVVLENTMTYDKGLLPQVTLQQ